MMAMPVAQAATGYTFWHLFFFYGRQILRKLDLFSVLSSVFLLYIHQYYNQEQ
jgi:hypothetical protein